MSDKTIEMSVATHLGARRALYIKHHNSLGVTITLSDQEAIKLAELVLSTLSNDQIVEACQSLGVFDMKTQPTKG